MSRTALSALFLSMTIVGCGSTITSSPNGSPDAAARCDPRALDACEQAIVSHVREGREAKPLLDAYMQARGANDPWATLWKNAHPSGQTSAIIIVEDGASTLRSAAKTPLVKIAPLPSPAAITTNALLEAVGNAAGWSTIVHVRRPSAANNRESLPLEVTEVFPNDPLAPFMAGLPPVVRDDDAIAHIDADIELAAAVRSAVDHASSFRYVDAAREAERIENTLRARDADAEPTLRAHYLLRLFDGAGITLEPSPGTSPLPKTNPTLPGASKTTPYGDMLRLRATKDDRAAFRVVGERLIAALPDDKRAVMRALFAPQEACIAVPLDAFDAPDDLFMAHWVGPRLGPSLTASGSSRHEGLGLTTWLPKYEALVRNVDDARTTWAHAFALTQERGEIGGISLATTPTHRRVDALVAAHLAALSQIVQAYPERARLMSIVTLAYSRGIVATPSLRDALVELLRHAVETRISRAADASALFEASLAGVLAATAYPPAIQAPVYSGLFSAFHDKLEKDFSAQTGWSVAGLFAADAAAAFLAGNSPDLGPVATNISRALADPSLPERPLGRLVSATVRYLALGIDRRLDPDAADPRRWPIERKAARDALREAVAGLSDPSTPLSPSLVDDLTMLGDQTITALAAILQDKQTAQGPVCAASASGPSPAVRRVLARIGDLRRTILAHPSFAATNMSASRLRFAVTVLSDMIDVASRKNKDNPVAFTIAHADADRAVTDTVATLDERALADAISSGYGIVRRLLAGLGAKGVVSSEVDQARKLVLSLALLFRNKDTGASVTLFDAFARAVSSRPHTQSGAADPPVERLLVDYARTLRSLGKPDQADLCVLGAMVAAAANEQPVRDEAIAAADESSRNLGWTLRFARETARVRQGLSPDPTTYASGMREVLTRSCEDPAVADQVVHVMDAMRLAATGERTKARAMLDDFLTSAEAQGFSLPRISYRYDEKTETKVFTTSLELSLGRGFLENASRFQVGLGVRTPGTPEGLLAVHLMPHDPERDVETVRYYVHVGASAALFHFLDGDTERGAATAARVIDAALFGVRLGARTFATTDPKTMAADARGTLAVVAVLAADAGMPLLAGDLWSLVGFTLTPDTDDRAIEEILNRLPIALAAVSSAKPPIERAKRGLRVVAEPLACTEQKVELGGYEAPACDEYPFALALRVGGALRKLPHLRRDPGKPCPASLPAIDAFLVGVEKGGYDPDAFTRAVTALVSNGRPYDAAVLLARQRQPTHCNPSLVAAARSIGRSPALGKSLRADILSVAVNCSLLDDAALADIALLDTETTMLPDRGRNLSLLMFAAELGVARQRWDVLGRLAKSPTFVSRWLDTNPRAALFAVVLAQAAAILAKEPSAADAASSALDLFCVKLPRTDAAACEAVETMRRSIGTADADRIAQESVAAALQRVAALRTKR